MAQFNGIEALSYLNSLIHRKDPKASSHWTHYHSTFNFSKAKFSGLQGFGNNSPRWSNFFHRLMQLSLKKITMQFSTYKSLEKIAIDITKKQKRAYDLDVLRQVLTLAFLKEKAPSKLTENSIACVIGDGFASMTSILIKSRSAKTVILVNLNKTLFVDLWYLKMWMGTKKFKNNVSLVTNKSSLRKALNQKHNNASKAHIIAIQAKHHHLIKECNIDIAINIASMQEMNPEIINDYFNDLRKTKKTTLFYCANREEKTLPDKTVTKFSEYPWLESDLIITDELCVWHRYYYKLIPPSFHAYDGPIRHRLVQLTPIA